VIPPPPFTILIVDDDPGSLVLLPAILEDTGLAVRTIQSAREALRLIEERAPDLLITDLRMPELNGLDLLRAARRTHPDLRAVVITGFATTDLIAEAFRAGAQDLVLKPFNVEETRARILHAVEVVCLAREVAALRAGGGGRHGGGMAPRGPARVRELAELPAVPGSGAPPFDAGTRRDLAQCLEWLAALQRAGVITAAEFEQKKRDLLNRL
jgi:two-component system response regulator PilR (NtrC family)